MTHQIRTNGYEIDDNPDRFDLPTAHDWITSDSYWAAGIPLGTFEKAIRGSLVVGAYDTGGQMAAMARVVTDRATFGWVCDVFVEPSRRGAGLGKALMSFIKSHPDLQGFRRLLLATRDAHGLYAQSGFAPLQGAEKWMEIWNPDVYRR
ncbi:MAG TPA: GNAT family N-acetyltransferase [Caulobacteraceae bacterium]